MPKPLRKPGYDVVPDRTHRRWFLDEMFFLYKEAGRPALHEVEKWIKENEDLRGTASTETVRRVLRGHVPPRWATVEAITLAFCALAGIDQRAPRHHDDYIMNQSPETHLEAAKRLWGDAYDEEPSKTDSRYAADDPWAEEPPS